MVFVPARVGLLPNLKIVTLNEVLDVTSEVSQEGTFLWIQDNWSCKSGPCSLQRPGLRLRSLCRGVPNRDQPQGASQVGMRSGYASERRLQHAHLSKALLRPWERNRERQDGPEEDDRESVYRQMNRVVSEDHYPRGHPDRSAGR